MKNLVLSILSVLSFSLAAQSSLSVTVTDSGVAAHGVSVFYYNSVSAFYPNGYTGGIDVSNFTSRAFTNANGVATFSLAGVSANDTVFWATQDCAGNLVWGAGMINTMMPNLNGTLMLTCLPGDCDAILRVDSFASPANGTTYLVQAYALRAFAQTSLSSTIPAYWTVNGTGSVGFTSSNWDSVMFNNINFTAPYSITYSRVDSTCSPISTSIGGGSGSNPTQVTCNPAFWADTLGQTATGYSMLFNDASISNGTIINYAWDFGDGTMTNGANLSNPTHSYAATGFYNVCLTITSVLGADTCSATYCDSLVYVAGGGSGGGGNPISCNAGYWVDTVNSGLFQNQLIIWEASWSTGNIVSYSWDFGDGTTISAQYPSHTYATTGVYPVCLTIVALDSAGIDTCVSTYCDSIGFDANGNLVYKDGQAGFTINVIDPATVGIEDLLLNQSLAMYPNPAKEKVNLSWDEALEVERVNVFSLTGQQVKSLEVSGGSAEISGLPSGAYLVRVESANASKTLRLIVE